MNNKVITTVAATALVGILSVPMTSMARERTDHRSRTEYRYSRNYDHHRWDRRDRGNWRDYNRKNTYSIYYTSPSGVGYNPYPYPYSYRYYSSYYQPYYSYYNPGYSGLGISLNF